jgi:hypothetical protein
LLAYIVSKRAALEKHPSCFMLGFEHGYFIRSGLCKF